MMPVDLNKLGDAGPSKDVDRRIVAGALARAFPEPKQRSFRWLVPVLVALALGFGVGGSFLFRSSRSPQLENPPELRTGSVAETTVAFRVMHAGRHEVRVESASRVVATEVAAEATRLRVAEGSARFTVAHLKPSELFRVEAGNLTVEAVGTQFDVSLKDGCALVDVSEGTVRVHRTNHVDQYLTQGNARTYCEAAAEEISEEERTVSAALQRARQGTTADLEQAAVLLRDYHERYPTGVYEQEALYYLARISLKLHHPDEAQAWAKRFLARFPQGRRAEELRSIFEPLR